MPVMKMREKRRMMARIRQTDELKLSNSVPPKQRTFPSFPDLNPMSNLLQLDLTSKPTPSKVRQPKCSQHTRYENYPMITCQGSQPYRKFHTNSKLLLREVANPTIRCVKNRNSSVKIVMLIKIDVANLRSHSVITRIPLLEILLYSAMTNGPNLQ